jgi:hypothetical protein
VELRRSLPEQPINPRLELVQPRPLVLTLTQAYKEWLFHGPLMAGIAHVEELGENGIVARLRPSSPQNLFRTPPSGSWLVDPVMVDSGLQLIILWARTYLGQTPLPTRLDCYHRFGGIPEGEVRCEVKIDATPGNPTLHSNLSFFGQNGRLIAWLKGMQATCSPALNRLSGLQAAATEGR